MQAARGGRRDLVVIPVDELAQRCVGVLEMAEGHFVGGEKLQFEPEPGFLRMQACAMGAGSRHEHFPQRVGVELALLDCDVLAGGRIEPAEEIAGIDPGDAVILDLPGTEAEGGFEDSMTAGKERLLRKAGGRSGFCGEAMQGHLDFLVPLNDEAPEDSEDKEDAKDELGKLPGSFGTVEIEKADGQEAEAAEEDMQRIAGAERRRQHGSGDEDEKDGSGVEARRQSARQVKDSEEDAHHEENEMQGGNHREIPGAGAEGLHGGEDVGAIGEPEDGSHTGEHGDESCRRGKVSMFALEEKIAGECGTEGKRKLRRDEEKKAKGRDGERCSNPNAEAAVGEPHFDVADREGEEWNEREAEEGITGGANDKGGRGSEAEEEKYRGSGAGPNVDGIEDARQHDDAEQFCRYPEDEIGSRNMQVQDAGDPERHVEKHGAVGVLEIDIGAAAGVQEADAVDQVSRVADGMSGGDERPGCGAEGAGEQEAEQQSPARNGAIRLVGELEEG